MIYINSYFISCSMGRKSSNKQTHEGDCNIPLFAPVGVGVVVGVRVGVGVVCRGGGGGGGRGSPTQKIGGNVYQGLGYDPGCRRVQGFPRDLRSPSAISRNWWYVELWPIPKLPISSIVKEFLAVLSQKSVFRSGIKFWPYRGSNSGPSRF